MNDEIKIFQSKKKIKYLIAYNAILIIISILMFIFASLLYFNFLVILSRIFAVIFIFVFGYNIVTLILQLNRPKELLNITNNGITDNTNTAIFNNIQWNEINSIDIINKEYIVKNEINHKTFIGIKLNNIDNILSIEDDYIKNSINYNIKNFESHIILDLESADCNINEIYDILKNRFNKYK